MMNKNTIPSPQPYKSDPYWNVARCYSLCLDPIIIKWKKKGMVLWPPRKGMRVLDVGCGTGAHLNLYQGAACDVFGIEISSGMIAASRQKYKERLNLCRADAARIPFRNQAFDLVLLSMMIHEISPQIRSPVLAEAKRVLKDSGRVLIIDYHCSQVKNFRSRLLRGIIALVEMSAGSEHFNNYRNFIKNEGVFPLLKTQRLALKRHATAAQGNIGLYVLQKELNTDTNKDTAQAPQALTI